MVSSVSEDVATGHNILYHPVNVMESLVNEESFDLCKKIFLKFTLWLKNVILSFLTSIFSATEQAPMGFQCSCISLSP